MIHFLYLRDKCSFKEILAVAKKNGIQQPIEQVLEKFKYYSIALLDYSRKTARRFNRIFRIPRDQAGRMLKDKFLKHEVAKSLEKDRTQFVGPGRSYVYSAILAFNEEGCSLINAKLTDLLAEITSQGGDLDNKGAVPYFTTMIISSREEYNA